MPLIIGGNQENKRRGGTYNTVGIIGFGTALSKVLKEKSWDEYDTRIREMRDCLVEGLTRADCLLPAAAQERHIRAAATIHERNYWRCMKKIGGMLRETGK